jgi:PfaD family protein
VRLSAGGLVEGPTGPRRARRVVAKVSRTEVARAFMTPPPEAVLRDLVASGRIDERQATWASRLPVAAAVTAEADSGGHTDNRPLVALLPALAALRASVATAPVALGAAGGLGTPEAVAAAFALGADYVLTGSINQSAVESGLSEHARALLVGAGPADVAMAPAADMFERGVQVQVLARGTLFAPTARRLYDIYRRRDSFDALDERERDFVERRVLREPFGSAWEQTRAWLLTADPALAAKGDRDPRQRLASVFRRYLFHAAAWARAGRVDRQGDYQVWCGPAMGAFNAWAEGSWLAEPQAREVGQIGLNLLEGAAQVTRAQQLRALGVAVGPQHFVVRPRRLAVDSASGAESSQSLQGLQG